MTKILQQQMRHHYTAQSSSVTFIVQTCIAHLYHFTVPLFSLAWQLSLLFQYHFHNLFLGSGFSLCSIDKLKHTMPFYCHFSMYVYLFFTHYHNTAAVFVCLSSSKRNYIYKMIHCSVPMERRLNFASFSHVIVWIAFIGHIFRILSKWPWCCFTRSRL